MYSRMTCGHAEWDTHTHRHILCNTHKQDGLVQEPKQYTPICWEETCCHGERMDVWISVWQWHFLVTGCWFTCTEGQLLDILLLCFITRSFDIQCCAWYWLGWSALPSHCTRGKKRNVLMIFFGGKLRPLWWLLTEVTQIVLKFWGKNIRRLLVPAEKYLHFWENVLACWEHH